MAAPAAAHQRRQTRPHHRLDTFRRLRAAPWAKRAEAELRACGVTAHTAAIPGRLFLSPRTVASHLYRSYPKLGYLLTATSSTTWSTRPTANTARPRQTASTACSPPGYAAAMVMRDGNERAGAGRRRGPAPGVTEPRMAPVAAPVADGIVAGRPCTVRKPMRAMV